MPDTIPPVFTSCPGDVVKKTELAVESVFWPKPIAEDNSLVATVTGSHEPNSHFNIGVTVVNYTAEDESGNRADCRFTVTVILGEYSLAWMSDKPCMLVENGEGSLCFRPWMEKSEISSLLERSMPPV